eukprot:scaffold2782_cov182-Amphora_coffeaeformis.AAC.31
MRLFPIFPIIGGGQKKGSCFDGCQCRKGSQYETWTVNTSTHVQRSAPMSLTQQSIPLNVLYLVNNH